MNIESIEIRAFPCQAGKRFELPRMGIVLVTGPNGVGKSGLSEAIAWAGWGKTIRGTTLDGASVRLVTDLATIDRDGAKLEWHAAGEDPIDYTTKTKASEALHAVIGDFELWARSAVFSSADTVSFSRARDSERKRILEELGGLAGFDRGLRVCRDERKAAEWQVQEYQRAHGNAALQLDTANQRIADSQAAMGAVGSRTLATVQAEWDSVAAEVKRLESSTVEAQQAAVQAEQALGAEKHHLSTALSNLQATEAGVCSTCGQAVEPSGLEQLRKIAQSCKTAVSEAGALLEQADTAYQASYRELAAAQTRWRALDRELGQAQAHDSVRQQCEATIAQAQQVATTAQAALDDALAALPGAQVELGTLRACETVLGLKGARVRVFARLLGSLESAANHYLALLAPPKLRIELQPYTENKGGGSRAAISLRVHGIGKHTEYRAASGGQRRRVDVACMLALAELAAAQRAPGTLFFDEVFDALDADGVATATELLKQLATTRAVVVVTHSPSLIAGLPTPAAHLQLR